MSQARPDRHVELAGRLALRPIEVARALGLSERTVRQLLPRLPHLRVGGAVLVPVEALREWLLAESRIETGKVDRVVDEILGDL